MGQPQLRLRDMTFPAVPSEGYIALVCIPALGQCPEAQEEPDTDDEQIRFQDVLATALALFSEGIGLIWLYLRVWLVRCTNTLRVGFHRASRSLWMAHLMAAAGWGLAAGLIAA